MKTRITTLISIVLICICTTASAVHKDGEDWKKNVMSEKIAFLTMEASLTPEEAQAFWPVYNKVNKEMDETMHEIFKSFRDLDMALKENKPVKEIEELMDKYLKAQEKQRKIGSNVAEEYKKVLSIDKVAKILIGEENFRRQHIRKLHGGGGPRK